MKTGLKEIQKTTIIEFNEQGPRITVTIHNTDLKKEPAGSLHPSQTAPYSEERREAAQKFAREYNVIISYP